MSYLMFEPSDISRSPRPINAFRYHLLFDQSAFPLLIHASKRDGVQLRERIFLTLDQYRAAKRESTTRGSEYVNVRKKALESLTLESNANNSQPTEQTSKLDLLVTVDLPTGPTPLIMADWETIFPSEQKVEYRDLSTPSWVGSSSVAIPGLSWAIHDALLPEALVSGIMDLTPETITAVQQRIVPAQGLLPR